MQLMSGHIVFTLNHVTPSFIEIGKVSQLVLLAKSDCVTYEVFHIIDL